MQFDIPFRRRRRMYTGSNSSNYRIVFGLAVKAPYLDDSFTIFPDPAYSQPMLTDRQSVDLGDVGCFDGPCFISLQPSIVITGDCIACNASQ